MQKVQAGDRVRVHYVKRFQDGSVVSSTGREPIELTVGADHPRLPGLGLALIGLTPGTSATISVPAALAYGAVNPARIRKLRRARFAEGDSLRVGQRLRVLDRNGRSRRVRVVEMRGDTVVVDTNHRWAGQAVEMRVTVIGIQAPDAGLGARTF